jgi:REP element-mobilizing transposase RayT
MPHWRIFLHIVWATKNRESLIDEQAKRIITRSIRTTLDSFHAVPHALGMVEDHIHVAVSIPSSIAPSDVIARMKGAFAHAVNDALPSHFFKWQADYGIYSFGEKALPDVVAYVNDQRERHANGKLWPSLERATDEHEPA